MTTVIDIDAVTEAWRFDCPRCGATWTVAYRKRRWTDGSGATFTWYYEDDTPAVPPLLPPLCRDCGYVLVRGRLAA